MPSLCYTMPSKFLVPFELPDYQGIPSSTADPGFVLAYVKHGWWTKHDGVAETDLVLQRPLDGFTEVDRYANPVTASDTVLGAIEKIQRSLSTLKLTGDVTGTAQYFGGELIIQTTGGGGIDCTELLNCQVIIDIQGNITGLDTRVSTLEGLPAASILSTDITNWNDAYSWGDHALAGYLTSYTETDPVFTASVAAGILLADVTNWNTAYGWGNHASAGYLTTETDPEFAASAAYNIAQTDIDKWTDAYGWGNHALAGYITAEADTLDTVTTRGNTTTNLITVGGITATGVTSTIYAGTATRLRTEANNVVFERLSSSGFMKIYINQTTLSPTAKSYMGFNNATLNVVLSNEQTSGGLELRTQDLVRQTIFANGNVAINTTTDSGYKLDVNGSIRAQGIFYGIEIRTGAHAFRDQMYISHTADGWTKQSTYNVAGAHALTFVGDLRFASSAAIKAVFAFNGTYSNNGTIYTGESSLMKIFTGDAFGNTVGTTNLNNYGVNLMPTLNYTTGTSTFTGYYYNPTVTSATGLTHYAMNLVTGLVKIGNLASASTSMVVADSTGVLSVQSIPVVPTYGFEDVLLNNPVLTGDHTIDGGGFSIFWDSFNKYGAYVAERIDFTVQTPTQSAQMLSVVSGGSTSIGLYTNDTSIGSAGIEVTPAAIYMKTPNYSTGSTGDVLTLVDPASGEVEFQTPTGGGIALTDLSASAPLQYNNTTGAFSITQATTSTDGYLSSTDWNTFNGKQDTLVSGTNIKTINGDSILGSGNELIFEADRAKYGYEYFTDFMAGLTATNATDGKGFLAIYSGTGTAILPSAVPTVRATNQQGFLQFATGTTATGYAGITANNTATNYFITGGGEMTYTAFVFLPTLSTSVERYRVVLGYGSVTNNNAEANGAFFTYDEGGTSNGSTASANWQCITSASSVRTLTTTTTAVSTSAWVKLTVVINAAANSVAFYIDNTLVATHTTNIPTGTSQLIQPKIQIAKTVGTTARSLYADYFGYRQTYTNAKT